MRIILLSLLFAIRSTPSIPGDPDPLVYLIPGQGSDHRLFNNLTIDSAYEVRHITYFIPKEGTTLRDFAFELSKQIDTSRIFSLIGVSLGGMIATEMSEFLNPEKVIVISSAKCRQELPMRYKFQRRFPAYSVISGKTAKKGAQVMQPIVEPDRRHEKATFKRMLKDKDPDFMKRTIHMIMEWDKSNYRGDIITIHGNNDKTIPIRNVSYDWLIENGSHMMTLTRGAELSELINNILSN